jgi:subtilase family serine protease
MAGERKSTKRVSIHARKAILLRTTLIQPLEKRLLFSGLALGNTVVTAPNTAGLSLPIVTEYAPGYSGVQTAIGGSVSSDAGLSSPYGGITPAQMRGAYGLSGLTYNGSGETIAILDPGDDPALVNSAASNFSTSDLAIFDNYYGIANPPSFTKMGFTDASSPALTTTLPGSGVSAGTVGEISLDVERP